MDTQPGGSKEVSKSFCDIKLYFTSDLFQRGSDNIRKEFVSKDKSAPKEKLKYFVL